MHSPFSRFLLTSVMGLCSLFPLYAQAESPSPIQRRGEEYYLQFQAPSRQVMRTLNRLTYVDRVEGKTVYAYATQSMLPAIRQAGLGWVRLPHPGDNAEAKMAPSLEAFRASYDTYPTYSQYVQLMQTFAAEFPELTRLVEVGVSQEGRKLLALRVTDNPTLEEAEPEVLYSSTMHGDETTGYVLMLHLIDELLYGYGVDPELTALVNDLDIWINPLANPDGTYAGGNFTVKTARRTLANGVDANRNFPDPLDGDHPDGKPWALETVAMMDWAQAESFSLSANFHGGAELVNYPWDTMPREHADVGWFIQLSRQYAEGAQTAGPSGYMDDQQDGITEGYAWYECNGTRQDWMVYFLGGREVTIELTKQKNPAARTLGTWWTANRQPLLDYLAAARTGIRGTVTDSQGNPVEAMITVVGHDKDQSQVYTDPDVGDYVRYLSSGTYTLEVSATGYQTRQVTGVTVVADRPSTVNVVLDAAR